MATYEQSDYAKSYTMSIIGQRWATIPKMDQLPGQITIEGKIVTGDGTDFMEFLLNPNGGNLKALKYQYILDPGTGAIHEIAYVIDGTHLMLKNIAAVDILVAVTLYATGSFKGTLKSLERIGDSFRESKTYFLGAYKMETQGGPFKIESENGFPPMSLNAADGSIEFNIELI